MGETLFATDELSLYTMSLIAGAVIVCLALLYWFLRRRGHMAFMRGGANRQPRLAVLDAAAVDARRRLVLVRRDDIEHLILIGGPSDLVVESGINRTAATTQAATAQPEKAKVPAAQRPPARAAKPAPQPQPAAKQPAKTDVEPQIEPVASPPPAEAKPEPVAQPPRPAPKPEPVAPPRRSETKPEQARPARPETVERKQPEEPVAPRAATATVVAGAAAMSNGHDGPRAEPVREAAAPANESSKPAPSSSQAASETPRQDAAQTAPAEKPGPDPAEQGSASPSPESEAIKTEFEDALDAARELVMPATTPASEAPPAPEPDVNYAHAVPPKPEPPKVAAAPPAAAAKTPVEPAQPAAASQQNVTAEDLIADFDRVLEAEMNKSEADQLPPTAGKQPEAKDSAENGASLEDEMKKLLGDLSAKQ